MLTLLVEQTEKMTVTDVEPWVEISEFEKDSKWFDEFKDAVNLLCQNEKPLKLSDDQAPGLVSKGLVKFIYER